MRLNSNPALYGQARYQRTHLMEMEDRLWEAVRGRKLGSRFHRQKVIGNAIVDFWCPKLRLVVEIHSDHFPYKPEREKELLKLGVRQILQLSPVLSLEQMVERVKAAMANPRKTETCGHTNSGLTVWGACWKCYTERIRNGGV